MGIKENTIKQFGRQAEAYSKGSIFPDREHLSEIVNRSGVKNDHRVLDIATGSGFLALEFAKKADIALGSDITRNMLVYALEKQRASGSLNTGFLLSDVESMPFPDDFFDIVSCRFAFHHFPDPVKALLEMKRVCRERIVLVDGTSSENMEKSQLHNRMEKIRDPSHVRIYTLEEMTGMIKDLGMTVVDIEHWDIPQAFEDWINRAGTDENKTNIIKDMMQKSVRGDSTGLRVKNEDGKLEFTYDTVILIAEKRSLIYDQY